MRMTTHAQRPTPAISEISEDDFEISEDDYTRTATHARDIWWTLDFPLMLSFPRV
jgi:hypothetical protein